MHIIGLGRYQRPESLWLYRFSRPIDNSDLIWPESLSLYRFSHPIDNNDLICNGVWQYRHVYYDSCNHGRRDSVEAIALPGGSRVGPLQPLSYLVSQCVSCQLGSGTDFPDYELGYFIDNSVATAKCPVLSYFQRDLWTALATVTRQE